MIKVTDEAIKHLSDELANIQVESEVNDPYIRLYMGHGWGGPRLQLALEESKSDDDELIEAGGLKFLIINNQKFYFENMTLDFVKNMFGMGEYTLVRPK